MIKDLYQLDACHDLVKLEVSFHVYTIAIANFTACLTMNGSLSWSQESKGKTIFDKVFKMNFINLEYCLMDHDEEGNRFSVGHGQIEATIVQDFFQN